MTLLALAAWLAERGSRATRRGQLVTGLGVRRLSGSRRVRPARAPIWAAWCIGAAVTGLVVAGPVGVVAGIPAGVVAHGVDRRRRSRTDAAQRNEQLVDAVTSIAAAIRAGRSVPQALSFAASEAREPLGVTLRDLEASLAVGVPLDDAILAWAHEVDTDDARLLAGVLRLHRRSGGDLPSVLDEVADTLRERRAAGREIRALTAQARLSGTILGVLPFGFFAFLWLTSRTEIEGALRSPAGQGAIALGLTLEALAFLWIRRLLEVR
jgi:tight adherence protein B